MPVVDDYMVAIIIVVVHVDAMSTNVVRPLINDRVVIVDDHVAIVYRIAAINYNTVVNHRAVVNHSWTDNHIALRHNRIWIHNFNRRPYDCRRRR